ncbi:hypothetical protein ABF62_09385 [Enterobacter hormaechei subsp. steigerwaltii]|uniref:hypothetical protein n=1 Tax=Enterobacter hormaechei TaxID=158836 RepID=UPI00064A82CC|nr:hypothetical protein [Enterobacter hormaechei]KLQ86288.1 hypothetical protein ABF62_09385 [Enterobacter hormaechei subsp. steigerwaltii]
MLSVLVSRKKIYILLPILISSYGIWCAVDEFIYIEQDIIRKENIGKVSVLYITESNAGATTSNVYKYYLASSKKSEEAFLGDVRNGYAPFLITTDPEAKVESKENALYITVSGKIYQFSNISYSTFIYLNSSPF